MVVDLEIVGLGMAAAVLIDATVVRGILVPAALALLGDRAWRRVGSYAAGRSQLGAVLAESAPAPDGAGSQGTVHDVQANEPVVGMIEGLGHCADDLEPQ